MYKEQQNNVSYNILIANRISTKGIHKLYINMIVLKVNKRIIFQVFKFLKVNIKFIKVGLKKKH